MAIVELDQITLKDFQAYEGVRKSGVINMWDAQTGCELTGLSRETWAGIIKYYSELEARFPGVR